MVVIDEQFIQIVFRMQLKHPSYLPLFLNNAFKAALQKIARSYRPSNTSLTCSEWCSIWAYQSTSSRSRCWSSGRIIHLFSLVGKGLMSHKDGYFFFAMDGKFIPIVYRMQLECTSSRPLYLQSGHSGVNSECIHNWVFNSSILPRGQRLMSYEEATLIMTITSRPGRAAALLCNTKTKYTIRGIPGKGGRQLQCVHANPRLMGRVRKFTSSSFNLILSTQRD